MKLRQQQQGTVEQYQEQFDSLLTWADMPVPYAVSCFLSGLIEEIQTAVRMFKPNTLHDAYCLAKLQEAILASMARRTRPILGRSPVTRSLEPRGNVTPTWGSSSYKTGTHARPSRGTTASSTGSTPFRHRPAGRRMSSREFEEKRAKNQCFYCDEKYSPGHKCAAQVYGLEVIGEDSPQEDEELDDWSKVVEEEVMRVQEEPLQLSLSALSEANSYFTMRVIGRVKNNPLHILLDSDSTHNFLDISTIKNNLLCQIHI